MSKGLVVLMLGLAGCATKDALPAEVRPSPPYFFVPLEARAQRLTDELVTIARMAVDLHAAEQLALAQGLKVAAFQPEAGIVTATDASGSVTKTLTLRASGKLQKRVTVRLTLNRDQVVTRRSVQLRVLDGDQVVREATREQSWGARQHQFIRTEYRFPWRDEGDRYAVSAERLENQEWTLTGSLDRPSERFLTIKVDTLDDGSVVARGIETPLTVLVTMASSGSVSGVQMFPSGLVKEPPSISDVE